MSSRMSIEEYTHWKASTWNIIDLRPINETLLKVTNTKLSFVTNTKLLIHRQPMYNL